MFLSSVKRRRLVSSSLPIERFFIVTARFFAKNERQSSSAIHYSLSEFERLAIISIEWPWVKKRISQMVGIVDGEPGLKKEWLEWEFRDVVGKWWDGWSIGLYMNVRESSFWVAGYGKEIERLPSMCNSHFNLLPLPDSLRNLRGQKLTGYNELQLSSKGHLRTLEGYCNGVGG